jgi:hypothetical protein
MALPFTLKSVLRKKEESWKLKYFTMQKYNLQKSSKETKVLIYFLVHGPTLAFDYSNCSCLLLSACDQ